MVDIAHFGNLFGTDCLTLIALTSLVVLAGAAENGDLDDDTWVVMEFSGQIFPAVQVCARAKGSGFRV